MAKKTKTYKPEQFKQILAVFGFIEKENPPFVERQLSSSDRSFEFVLPNRPGDTFYLTREDNAAPPVESRSLYAYGPAIFPGSEIGQQPDGFYLVSYWPGTEDVVGRGRTPEELVAALKHAIPRVLAEIYLEYIELAEGFNDPPKPR